MALAEQVALNQLEMDHDTVRTTVLHVNGRNVSWASDNKVIPNNLIPIAVTSAGNKKKQAGKELLEKATLGSQKLPLSDQSDQPNGGFRNALSSAIRVLTCRYHDDNDDDDDLLETKVVPASDRFLPAVNEVLADGRTKAPKTGACGATCDIRNSPNRILKKMPRHQQEDACGTEANFHGVLGHDLSKRGHWLTRAIDKIY